MKLRALCPAKINTFLSVGPPGAGGYHPIRTYFQAVGLFDELVVERAQTTTITCEGMELPLENTLSRALALLSELYSLPGLSVHLTKRIPAESGLGGGSSDAAGLIRAIAQLLSLPIDQHLMDVGSAVGKDVPFFLVGGSAKGEGFGDQVTPLDDMTAKVLLLAKPNEGVSSAAGYALLDAAPRPFEEFPSDFWTTYNDFERVAPCVCGELAERMKVAGAVAAGLSGSGSAVFGVFDDEPSAHQAEQRMAHEFPGVWMAVVPTLTRLESLNMERLD